MTTETAFRQVCDACTRKRTTLPSLARSGGWRPFADWWMCPTCVQQSVKESAR